MKDIFSEPVRSLPLSPGFLERVGGINPLIELFKKKFSGRNLSNNERRILFEAEIQLSIAYRKKFGEDLLSIN